MSVVVTPELARDDLLFSATQKAGAGPVSRNTFRTRVWLPAVPDADDQALAAFERIRGRGR